MRNTLAILAVFCVGSALVACNSESKPSPANKPVKHEKNDVSSLGWMLKYQAKCSEDIDPSECTGAYGFVIEKNGDYTVGPDSKGQIRSGKLSESDLGLITSSLQSTISQNGLKPEAQAVYEEADGKEIQISFMRGTGAPEDLVKVSGSDIFYQMQSLEEAKTLLANMNEFASKYAAHFPDNCKEGATAFNLLMNEVQKCNADADCAYLNDGYEVIPNNSGAELTTDTCSIVNPLVVGNIALVRENANKLAESLNAVQAACGYDSERMARNEECSFKFFKLTGAAPVCQAGKCKLPAQ